MTEATSKDLIPKLKGSENYFSWVVDVSSVLRDQTDFPVWEIVNGTTTAPSADATDAVRNAYTRCHCKALRILATNIDPSLKALVTGIDDARAIWVLLKARFATMEIAQIDVLRRRLRSMKQGDKQSVQDFITKWDVARKELVQYGNQPEEYELAGELIRSLNKGFDKSREYLFGALQQAVDKAELAVNTINAQANAQVLPAAASVAYSAATSQAGPASAGVTAATTALNANLQREAAIRSARSRIIEDIVTAIYRSEAIRILDPTGNDTSRGDSKALNVKTKKGKKDSKKSSKEPPSDCKMCKNGRHWHKDCPNPIYDIKTGKRLEESESKDDKKQSSKPSKTNDNAHAVVVVAPKATSHAAVAATTNLPWHCDSGAADHMSCIAEDF